MMSAALLAPRQEQQQQEKQEEKLSPVSSSLDPLPQWLQCIVCRKPVGPNFVGKITFNTLKCNTCQEAPALVEAMQQKFGVGWLCEPWSDIAHVTLLKAIIATLKVSCPYKAQGCMNAIAVKHYREHIGKCKYGAVSCVKCGVEIVRLDSINENSINENNDNNQRNYNYEALVTRHQQQECEARIVSCHWCAMTDSAKVIERHSVEGSRCCSAIQSFLSCLTHPEVANYMKQLIISTANSQSNSHSSSNSTSNTTRNLVIQQLGVDRSAVNDTPIQIVASPSLVLSAQGNDDNDGDAAMDELSSSNNNNPAPTSEQKLNLINLINNNHNAENAAEKDVILVESLPVTQEPVITQELLSSRSTTLAVPIDGTTPISEPAVTTQGKQKIVTTINLNNSSTSEESKQTAAQPSMLYSTIAVLPSNIAIPAFTVSNNAVSNNQNLNNNDTSSIRTNNIRAAEEVAQQETSSTDDNDLDQQTTTNLQDDNKTKVLCRYRDFTLPLIWHTKFEQWVMHWDELTCVFDYPEQSKTEERRNISRKFISVMGYVTSLGIRQWLSQTFVGVWENDPYKKWLLKTVLPFMETNEYMGTSNNSTSDNNNSNNNITNILDNDDSQSPSTACTSPGSAVSAASKLSEMTDEEAALSVYALHSGGTSPNQLQHPKRKYSSMDNNNNNNTANGNLANNSNAISSNGNASTNIPGSAHLAPAASPPPPQSAPPAKRQKNLSLITDKSEGLKLLRKQAKECLRELYNSSERKSVLGKSTAELQTVVIQRLSPEDQELWDKYSSWSEAAVNRIFTQAVSNSPYATPNSRVTYRNSSKPNFDKNSSFIMKDNKNQSASTQLHKAVEKTLTSAAVKPFTAEQQVLVQPKLPSISTVPNFVSVPKSFFDEL
jgi:hypothetical protein